MNLSQKNTTMQRGAFTLGMIIKGLILFAVLYWLISPWLGDRSLLSSLSSLSSLNGQSGSKKSGKLRQVMVGKRTYTFEVVNTPEDLTEGLGGRTEVGSDGMLFDLGGEQVANFWMKDMLFPIDMIWIYKGKIVSYTPNAQPPKAGTQDSDLQQYESGQLVDMVLEVPAGFTIEEGFAAGMDVVIVE